MPGEAPLIAQHARPRFIWHDRVHRVRCGEELHFARVGYDGRHDRVHFDLCVSEACSSLGISSVLLYETYGTESYLLRLWLPQGVSAPDFESAFQSIWPSGSIGRIRFIWFPVQRVGRHHLFAAGDDVYVPEPDSVASLTDEIVGEVETCLASESEPPKVVSDVLGAGLVVDLRNDEQNEPGSKFACFFRAISPLDELHREHLFAEVNRALDRSGIVSELSLYLCSSGVELIAMGRVSSHAVHEFNSRALSRLSKTKIFQEAEIRIETVWAACAHFLLAAETAAPHAHSRPAVTTVKTPSGNRGTTWRRDLDQDLLGDRYLRIRFLGEGGFGRVHQFYDFERRRYVAIKEFDPNRSAEARQEAEVLRGLDHPHIVRYHDILELDEGDDVSAAVVMEYCDGLSMRHRLNNKVQLAVDEAVPVIAAVLDALDYAHPGSPESLAQFREEAETRELDSEELYEFYERWQNGVIHRDVKPENIMFTANGELMRLVDFNIAVRPSDPTSQYMGTPGYLAPDAGIEGWHASDDVYACGVTLFEMLRGRRLNMSDASPSERSLEDIVQTEVDRLLDARADVHELNGVGDLLVRALAPFRGDRFQSASEMREAIEQTGAI